MCVCVFQGKWPASLIPLAPQLSLWAPVGLVWAGGALGWSEAPVQTWAQRAPQGLSVSCVLSSRTTRCGPVQARLQMCWGWNHWCSGGTLHPAWPQLPRISEAWGSELRGQEGLAPRAVPCGLRGDRAQRRRLGFQLELCHGPDIPASLCRWWLHLEVAPCLPPEVVGDVQERVCEYLSHRGEHDRRGGGALAVVS